MTEQTQAPQGSTSVQLVRVDSIDMDNSSRTLTTTRLDVEQAKPTSVKVFTKYATEELKTALDNLEVGDEVVLHKKLNGKFWNLENITDKSTYVKKEKKEWKPDFQKSGAKKEYDNNGPVIGMVFNNAVLVALKNNKQDDEEYILNKALELLALNRRFDEQARAQLDKKAVKETKTEAEKQTKWV